MPSRLQMESHTFSSFLKHGVMDNASVFDSRLKKHACIYEQVFHQTYQILAINVIPDFSQIITKETTTISAVWSSKKHIFHGNMDALSQLGIQLSCSTNILLKHSRKGMRFDSRHQCGENCIQRV
ncbi:hypothetical protein Anapl_05652 [Anas platyrhynchos]|uniref:Uncharacterized protein n=1 Tax=Anas platyrhynchos TaxID=8839 RepID=R0M1L7_ANAPL|nr:hypothetical protein Anapl_05652 [Anas platyrhynchos]